MPLRIATFNVENLYARFDFAGWRAEDRYIGTYRFEDGRELERARAIADAIESDDKRQLTALALVEADADIIGLQEVDDRKALEIFNERYVKRVLEPKSGAAKRAERARLGRDLREDDIRAIDRRFFYDWRVLVEGNDGRGIDVAAMSRHPVTVRSHANRSFDELDAWSPAMEAYSERVEGQERRFRKTDRVFRRDCLEVTAEPDGREFVLFVCHFKSMSGGRDRTQPMREAEARAVRAVVTERFGTAVADASWAICGDLNDYTEIDGIAADSALAPLLADGFAVDMFSRRKDPLDRWTAYHAPDDQYAALDHILLSPALARRNPQAVPQIVRAGQPWRAARHAGPRYPRVGWDRPKASDHCPVVIELADW